MVKLEADIKTVAKGIIQGNEKRKKRIKANKGSTFDVRALSVVEDALRNSCGNIESSRQRKRMQDIIYNSIIYNTPYEYCPDVFVGRRQFYEMRMEFIAAVADGLEMLPDGQQEPG